MSFTKNDKDHLVSKITDLRLKEEKEALDKEITAFCKKVARESLGMPDSLLEKIPEGVLATTNFMSFYDKNSHVLSHKLDEHVPVRGSLVNRYDTAVPVTGRTLTEAVAFAKKKEALDKKRLAIREAVRSVVYSVSSAKKLLEVWPEVAQIVTIEVEVKKNQVSLVPLVKNVNQLLGLKPVEKTAKNA
jgi:hypothetical protein